MKSWIDPRFPARREPLRQGLASTARLHGALLLSLGLHAAFAICLSQFGGLHVASLPHGSSEPPLKLLLSPLPDRSHAVATVAIQETPEASARSTPAGTPDASRSRAPVAQTAAQTATDAPQSAVVPIADSEYLPARLLDARPSPQAPVILAFPEVSLGKPRGTALLRLYVGSDGHVDRIEVEASDLPAEFALAAIETFRQVRMHPGMKDGRQVRALMKILVEYEAR